MSSSVPTSDMDAIRLQIYEARRAKNLTQQQLAQAAGVNHRSVSAIERGDMDPSVKTLLLILAALGLGVSLGLLLTQKGGSQHGG